MTRAGLGPGETDEHTALIAEVGLNRLDRLLNGMQVG